MKTNRYIKKLGLLLALMMMLMTVACGEKPEPTAKIENQSEKEIVLAGYRNLAPGNEDGYYCSKILCVWEPLITQDDEGNPVPGLAESWQMSPDGKEWTFKLRQGVQFHDGEPFNAGAVVANFDRMKLGVKKSAFYPLDIETNYPHLESYARVDDSTFKLTFSEPSPTILYNMVNFGSPIYSPKNFDAEGNFKGLIAGTGPFKITENELDQYLLLERNDAYYGEKAKAKNIRIKVIPDEDTRYAALKSGEIMGVLDLNAISGSLARELEKDENMAVSTSKSTMIRFLTLNGTKAPFNDLRMRQAVSLVINRKALVEDIYFGFGVPTSNILNYGTPFYTDYPVAEDMAQAKALAKEVLGDKRVSVDYMYNAKEAAQKGEAELMASWLKEIGLDCQLKPMEMKSMKEEMKKGDYGIARMQQGLSNAEPSTIFRRFMLAEGDNNQNYNLAYENEKVNQLMKEAGESLDLEKRKANYNAIQEISTKDLPVVPLFNDLTIVAYNKALTGYEAKLYGIDLPKVGWKE